MNSPDNISSTKDCAPKVNANPKIPNDASKVGVETPQADKTRNAPTIKTPYLIIDASKFAMVLDFLPLRVTTFNSNSESFDTTHKNTMTAMVSTMFGMLFSKKSTTPKNLPMLSAEIS